MIAVVQRCTRGEVRVEGESVGALNAHGGLVVLLGVDSSDDSTHARKMAEKIAKLRVFDDAQGTMNLCASEVGASILIISQFTLLGDCSSGNRPSYIKAARPEAAQPLVDEVVLAIRATGLAVETGKFRTQMQVELVNDGPVTLIVRV